MRPKLKSKVAKAIYARACVGITAKTSKKKRRILIALVERDGKNCHWCRQPIFFQWEPGYNWEHPMVATFDHKKLACQGGPHTVDNGVPACRGCNSVRGDIPFKLFTQMVAEQGIESLVARSMKYTKQLAADRGFTNAERKAARAAAKAHARMCKAKRRAEAEAPLQSQPEPVHFVTPLTIPQIIIEWLIRVLSRGGQLVHQSGVAF